MGVKRLILPLFKHNIRIFLSIIILGALSIAIVVGLGGSFKSLSKTVYDYIDECQYPDVTFNTNMISKNYVDMDAIRKVEGVKDAQFRMSMDFAVTHEDEILTLRMYTYSDETFMKYYTVSKIESDAKYPLKVDVKFAELNGLKCGDILNATIYNKSIPFTITEIVTSAENYTCKQNEYLMSSSSTFGYAYVDEKLIGNDYLKLFNQLLILSDGSVSNDCLRDRVKEVFTAKTTSIKTKEESIVVMNVRNNIDALDDLSIAVPALFFLITMVVMTLFIYQVVLRRKRDLGVLLTIGYDKKSLYLLFVMISIIISIMASILGLLIGYGIECYAYYRYIDHFKIEYTMPMIDILGYALSIFVMTIVSILSSLISTSIILKNLTPLEIVREPSISAIKGIRSKKIRAGAKVELNRVIRNYKENLIAVFSIISSFIMIFMGLVFSESNKAIEREVFESRIHYDSMLFLDTKDEKKVRTDLSKMSSIDSFELTYFSEFTITSKDGRSATALFNAIDEDSKLLSLVDERGEVTTLPTDGIMIEEDLAGKIDVKVGDKVTVNGIETFVASISKQSSFWIEYLNKDLFLKITDSYFLSANVKGQNRSDIIKDVSVLTYFQSSCDTDSMREKTQESEKEINVGVSILVIMGLLIGITITTNIKEMEFVKDSKYMAIKKTIGVHDKSISSSMIVIDLSRFLFAMIIGIPLARAITKVFISRMKTDTIIYPYVDSMPVYALCLVLILSFMAITHMVIMRRIRNMNISEYMKDKE